MEDKKAFSSLTWTGECFGVLMFDDMHKGGVTDMTRGVNYSDVVFMFEVVSVVFGDFVRKMMWVKAKELVMSVAGLHGGHLLVPFVDHYLSWIGGQKFRPLGL